MGSTEITRFARRWLADFGPALTDSESEVRVAARDMATEAMVPGEFAVAAAREWLRLSFCGACGTRVERDGEAACRCDADESARLASAAAIGGAA